MKLLIAVISLVLPLASLSQRLFSEAGDTQPLQLVRLNLGAGTYAKLYDGKGREYATVNAKEPTFLTGGAAGRQTVRIFNREKKLIDSFHFMVRAATNIDDGGRYADLFSLLHSGMYVYSPNGIESSVTWKGIPRFYLVSWVLDNYNTMKGMQYFVDYGKNLVETMHQMQRPDGMIWSFISSNKDWPYFKTAYEKYGFFLQDGDAYFVRQPVENHVEYNYVSSIYKCWKADGNNSWMKDLLHSAEKALDYCMNDSLRWSDKYQLLKRALTIDSWDFQADDEYTPQLGIGNAMLVVNGKTKFGIFYGDNTGYMQACRELAEMFLRAGDAASAEKFRARAAAIEQRLNDLAWNGKFYTHFIEEDSTVKRKLGVDVKQQVSQSNAYSLNRGIDHARSVAIIKTYQQLKNNLPKGAPAEWYAIYPPFQTGFGAHNELWQYMNGGVGGHVAGELALGAFENGSEDYGVDILNRLQELGKKYGDNKRIWFAYTGAYPDPPPVNYKPLNIQQSANKDWRKEFPGMPSGATTVHDIPFNIPAGGNNAFAIANRKEYPGTVSVPVDDSAGCIYLLHTGMNSVADNVYGTIVFKYADSTEKPVYIFKEKQLSNWWFPKLENNSAGIGWQGPNANAATVGYWWAAIDNPLPAKKIARLIFNTGAGESIYSVFAITLASRQHYIRPRPESFGGPDNWAAATGMAALVEGLAGVKDKSTAYDHALIAPRWTAANTDSVNVCIQYAASGGYVSYRLVHDEKRRQMKLCVTGSGKRADLHILLPGNARAVSVESNGVKIPFGNKKMEASGYVDFSVLLDAVQNIKISYQ